MSLTLSVSPDLTQIAYPDTTFLNPNRNESDETAWEYACEWLAQRRALQDMNQFEIGWMAVRIVSRYGEGGRTKWARAGGYSPSTIGKFCWVASRWSPEEVRHIASVAPNFSFKHFTVMTVFKEQNPWEDVCDWAEQAADFNWSAETLKAKLNGDESEDAGDQLGKPMLVSGQLVFMEVWTQDMTGAKIKRPGMVLILADDTIDDVVDKATLRGFTDGYVDVLIRLPKDDVA